MKRRTRKSRSVILLLPVILMMVASNILSAAHATEKPRIAVLDLIPSRGTTARPSEALADKVSEALQNTGQFRIFDRNILKQRMKERKLAATDLVDQARRLTEFGKELDVTRFIWGRYTDMGQLWSISLFMVDVTTGEQLGVVTEDPEGKLPALMAAAPSTARRLIWKVSQGQGKGSAPAPPQKFDMPDIAPVELPPMPAGVDELDARIRQMEAVQAELKSLRETMTEQHPHVVFYRKSAKKIAEELAPDILASLTKLEKHRKQMERYYKPNHYAMKEIKRRVDTLNSMLSRLPIQVIPVASAGFYQWRGKKYPREVKNIKSGIELVLIEPGEFTMGSPSSESGRDADEGPQHGVRIGRPFYLGKYEVTQKQYRLVMGTNPSHFKGENHPVEKVSWNDAKEFCRKLGEGFRLPTEAEWEFACRGGTTTPFYFGNTISTDQANYDGNYVYGNGKKGIYRERTVPVDSFSPNKWGLYNMHGNVWEWCEDDYHSSYKGAPTDGSAWGGGKTGNSKVLRGGSWYKALGLLRSANRDWCSPAVTYHSRGFRISWTL